MSEVVFVGTSDAFGAGGRRQSAIVLRGTSGTALLDCGATTGSGLHALGIAIDEIDAILISHFHGDHFGGVPLLLLAALYQNERKHPLWIAGPPGVEARVRRLAASMGHDLNGRAWTFPITFEELPAGRSCQVGPASVQSFETHHSPDAIPHGLRIDAGGPKIAYSGDTGWFDALPEHVAGSDLFICECTYRHNLHDGFDYHLSYDQLCEHHARFDCGRMVITHLGEEMADRSQSGEFETADDGLVLKL